MKRISGHHPPTSDNRAYVRPVRMTVTEIDRAAIRAAERKREVRAEKRNSK